jgi:hypothetical protein
MYLLFLFPPTPNDPDKLLECRTDSQLALTQSCVTAIRALLDHPPTNNAACPSTPAYTYFGIISACATLRQSCVVLVKSNLDPSLFIPVDQLHAAEVMIAGHEGLPGFVYRNMWKFIDERDGEDAGQNQKWPMLNAGGDVDWAAVFKDLDLDELLASIDIPGTGI